MGAVSHQDIPSASGRRISPSKAANLLLLPHPCSPGRLILLAVLRPCPHQCLQGIPALSLCPHWGYRPQCPARRYGCKHLWPPLLGEALTVSREVVDRAEEAAQPRTCVGRFCLQCPLPPGQAGCFSAQRSSWCPHGHLPWVCNQPSCANSQDLLGLLDCNWQLGAEKLSKALQPCTSGIAALWDQRGV